jgi:hypothetical protein
MIRRVCRFLSGYRWWDYAKVGDHYVKIER